MDPTLLQACPKRCRRADFLPVETFRALFFNDLNAKHTIISRYVPIQQLTTGHFIIFVVLS